MNNKVNCSFTLEGEKLILEHSITENGILKERKTFTASVFQIQQAFLKALGDISHRSELSFTAPIQFSRKWLSKE